ncbi:MAG TPA: SagB/ThcOx family dehydrogenase [Acidimicrobiia bacterium]|nr:SagB/ThcOx family dehydrogenase [Acidimicrobiia bacterium]
MTTENDTLHAEHFENFWEASSYSTFNIRDFANAQEAYSSRDKEDSILEYPSKPHVLPFPKSDINKTSQSRQSDRDFSEKELSEKELGIILSSFHAHNGLEHRAYPSAGAAYALEIFCVANNVENFSGSILYYNPDLHAISVIGDAPSWDEAETNIYVETTGIPQCVIIFVLFTSRLTEKYLERGGRFGLIEVGAAVQQLALQLAESKHLKGVAAGGLIDDYWLEQLNLTHDQAKIALGYLCGK